MSHIYIVSLTHVQRKAMSFKGCIIYLPLIHRKGNMAVTNIGESKEKTRKKCRQWLEMSVYMDFFFHVNLADKQENEQTAL